MFVKACAKLLILLGWIDQYFGNRKALDPSNYGGLRPIGHLPGGQGVVGSNPAVPTI